MQGGQKILYNTIILYVRMFISIAIGLYSTRVILYALGASDFGLYNLLAGVVAMLSFLNSSMAATTQRFISHTLGAGDLNMLKKVFSTSITTHIVISIVVVVLLEVFGIYFLKYKLAIPADRVSSAVWVFHLMVFTTFVSIITVPFDGLLNAHENFLVISLSEIFLSIGSLATAVYLVYTGSDKLIVYAILTTLFFVVKLLFSQLYCRLKYSECTFNIVKFTDIVLFKEIVSFAGWNVFGALCSVARNQGIAVVLNMFFGVILNAAYGIASQVNGQLISLSSVIGKAISPQLTKSEGEGNRDRMLHLGMLASKIPFMLMALASVALFIEMPYVLTLWLKIPPDNTVILTRLFLILSLLGTLSSGIITTLLAIGQIKMYQITVGGILLLNVPISWWLFKIGFPSYSAILVAIVLEVISHFLRLIFLRKFANASIKEYVINIDLKPLLVVIVSYIVTYSLTRFITIELLRLIVVCVFSIAFMIFGWFKYSLSLNERRSIESFVLYIKTNSFLKKL